MVNRPEEYPFSSHRANIGLGPVEPVDVEPVRRRFGPRKKLARERFASHVAAAMGLGHLSSLYETKCGVLGSEEFVASMIHRIGEFRPKGTPRASKVTEMDADALMASVATLCKVTPEEICSKSKGRHLVAARGTLIVAGRRAGMSTLVLSQLTGLSIATISRRYDAALQAMKNDDELEQSVARVMQTLNES